jgi:hypothetical protein
MFTRKKYKIPVLHSGHGNILRTQDATKRRFRKMNSAPLELQEYYVGYCPLSDVYFTCTAFRELQSSGDCHTDRYVIICLNHYSW